MQVIRYTSEYKNLWDSFVEESKNGTFLHKRDYTEYHADRFTDYSLLIFDSKGELFALMPGNIGDDKIFYSHRGLTYGGLVIGFNAGQIDVNMAFDAVIAYLKEDGCKGMQYKCIPEIYHKIPAQEDLYSLFCNGATLISRKPSCALISDNNPGFEYRRKRGVKKAAKSGIDIMSSDDTRAYWSLLENTLSSRFGAKPVHTYEEISNLKTLFPANIKCYIAENDGEVLAGVIIYETEQTAHTQYIVASEDGKKKGALDALFDKLINNIYKDKRWFDFGTSTGEDPRQLNEGLIIQKEGFGARAVMYDVYEINFE